MVFLRIALNNLMRHRTRSTLTLVGIATSVAVLFSILSFNRSFEAGLSRELERTGLHFMVVPSGCPHEVASLVLHGSVIPKFLDLSVMDAIRKVPNIEFASPILVGQLPDPERGRVNLVYGLELENVKLIKPGWQIDGALPSRPDEIVLGSEVASHLGLGTGGSISYQGIGKTFAVSGILRRTGSQDDAFIYMPVKTAQEIFRKPSGATAIGIRMKDTAMVMAATDRLTEQVPGIQIVTMNQVMNSIANLAASAKVMSVSIAVIALIVSAVGVMNAMLMAVFERTQEIGMMRAIGASRNDVFRIILKEAVFLTVSGGVAGIMVSIAGSGAIEAFVRRVMPYVPAGALVTFEPGIALGSMALVILIGVLSGIYPAWQASRISPIEAIKG